MSKPYRKYATNEEMIAEGRRQAARIHPSKKWQPLVQDTEAQRPPTHKDAVEMQHWYNDTYLVGIWRFTSGWPFGGGPWAKLGISCHDGHARHDWREYQQIKNQLCGADWEAVELYPAEARLVDPSNYFYLWAAPSIPLGLFDGRRILTPANCVAAQRGWHPADQPPDADSRAEEFNHICRTHK